ncbi:MAG: IS110 family transposase [Actinomycetia bacterium]|nr:IS110 family transposase [Actinomycetes bacterium]
MLRQLEFHGTELGEVERDIEIEAIDDPVVARLMTVPGIDVAVAVSILAAVGDFSRFEDPNKLVSYLGLNPRVRQSGDRTASHGRITKSWPVPGPGMLVEAAFAALRSPGPLRAFYKRITNRRGLQVAIVATAREDDGAVLASGHQRPGLRVRSAWAECPDDATPNSQPGTQPRSRNGVPPTTTTTSGSGAANERSSNNKNTPTRPRSPTGNQRNRPHPVDSYIRGELLGVVERTRDLLLNDGL